MGEQELPGEASCLTKGVWERSGVEVESVIFAVLEGLSYLAFRLGGVEKDRRYLRLVFEGTYILKSPTARRGIEELGF